jgi:ABC-type dipeptide/oligopeptide/nickel transport system permease component
MTIILRRSIELLIGAGLKFYAVLMVLFFIVYNLQNTYLEDSPGSAPQVPRSFFQEFHGAIGNTWSILVDSPDTFAATTEGEYQSDYSEVRGNQWRAFRFTMLCLFLALAFALLFMVLHFYSMARMRKDLIGALAAWLPYCLPVLLMVVLLKDIAFPMSESSAGLGSFMRRSAMVDTEGQLWKSFLAACICALVVLVGDGRLGQIMQASRESFHSLTREPYMQYVRSRGAATWSHGKYELALTFFDQVWVKVPQLISILMVAEIFFSQHGLGLLLKKQLGILVSAKNSASQTEYISFFMTIIQIVAIIIFFDLVYGMARVLIDPRTRHARA